MRPLPSTTVSTFCAIRSRRSQGAFTLVELLLVMIVIAIMWSVLAPALSGVLGGSTLTRSGNLVVNMVNQARQTAVTKNTMTALMILGNAGTADDFRALTVLEYDQKAGWLQTGNWERLSGRTVVDFLDADHNTFLAHASAKPFPFLDRNGQEDPPIRYRGQQIPPGPGYAVRIFLPSGALRDSQVRSELRLVEGIRQGSSSIQYVNKDEQGRPKNFYDIAILGLSGGTKVSKP